VKRAAGGLLVAMLALLLAVAWRSLSVRSRQVPPGAPAEVRLDVAAAAARLAGAIRFRTVAPLDAAARDLDAFLGLHDYLRTSFPLAHQALAREVVAGASLLYHWAGDRRDLAPVILLAHLDVVPADGRAWTHPPFDGVVAGGRVWGRGALDDKSSLVGILEAVEALLAAGFRPARPVYLAFSHNEEGSSDPSGAAAMASALGARNVRDGWLLDEGGLIYDQVPGVAQPVALVGVAEKATLHVELRARAAGGHASMPAAETAVGLLARALDRIGRQPMRPRLDAANPTRQMLVTLAPEMRWVLRTAVANLWLLRPLVIRQLAATPPGNATIRTTLAPTMLTGGPRPNVLPEEAIAVLNVRMVPGDLAGDVERHLRMAIDDDRVTIAMRQLGAASRVSPVDGPEFAALARAIRATHPDVLVAPYLTIAATDAREFADVAPFAYRFLPVQQPGAVALIHGDDEHIDVDVYERAIRTYATILKDLTKADR
jgi:carboxypeptidase PM20D1